MFSVLTAGELLGVEYLYDQTGRALQLVPEKHQTAEMENVTDGDDDDDDGDDDTEDEGFAEALNLDDPTIAPPQLIIEQRSDCTPSRSSTQHGRHTLCPCLHKKKTLSSKILFLFPSDNHAFHAPSSPKTSSSLSLSPPRASIAELRMPSTQSGKCIFFTTRLQIRLSFVIVSLYSRLGKGNHFDLLHRFCVGIFRGGHCGYIG